MRGQAAVSHTVAKGHVMRLTRGSMLPLVCLGLARTVPAAGQAMIVGVVTDDSSRAPLADVEVLLEREQRRVVTGADGLFRLDNLRPGVSTLLFRKIGYRPVRMRAVLLESDTVRRPVNMVRTLTVLEPVEVTASSYPPGMETYAEHKARGFGTFFDATVLRKQEHRKLSELLRQVPSVQPLKQRRAGRDILVMSSSRGGGLSKQGCPMAIWLDGVKLFEPRAIGTVDPPDINQYMVSGLEAIEVYRSAAETPPQLAGTGASCGTIALWTRRR